MNIATICAIAAHMSDAKREKKIQILIKTHLQINAWKRFQFAKYVYANNRQIYAS